MLVKQDFQIEKDKFLLRLFRKAITALSRMDLSNLEINAEANFKDEFGFSIVIFNSEKYNNRAFFYPFEPDDRLSNRLETVIDAIKKDDFETVVKAIESDSDKRWTA